MYIAHITELQNDVGHAVRKLMGCFTLADRCSSRPFVGQVERFSEISYERLKYAVSSLAPSIQCNEMHGGPDLRRYIGTGSDHCSQRAPKVFSRNPARNFRGG